MISKALQGRVHAGAPCMFPRTSTVRAQCSVAQSKRSNPQTVSHVMSIFRSVRGDRVRSTAPLSRSSSLLCRASLSPAAPGETTLGFVGIGIMGLGMATNLIKAGYKVVVWNRNPDKCAPLVAIGAELAKTPKEVAQKSAYTFAMLSDPPAALAVASGPEGICAGLSPSKGYIDVSTVDAETSRQVSTSVRETGALYLEAPVSGSKKPAEDGQLIFLVAGDMPLFLAVSQPLEIMGKASFFLGEVGAGANMKLVVNMIMGTCMTAFAEGMALTDKTGLKQEDLLKILSLGAVNAPMFQLKGPNMGANKYPPAFPLKHQQKDMRLALELGEEVGQALPTASAANSLYLQAAAKGLGDADFSAVKEAVKPQDA